MRPELHADHASGAEAQGPCAACVLPAAGLSAGEKAHVAREEEVHAAGYDVKYGAGRIFGLAVHIYDLGAGGGHLDVVGAQEGDILGELTVAPGGVGGDGPQYGGAPDPGDYQHVQQPVVGPGVVGGVEAAAVEAAGRRRRG